MQRSLIFGVACFVLVGCGEYEAAQSSAPPSGGPGEYRTEQRAASAPPAGGVIAHRPAISGLGPNSSQRLMSGDRDEILIAQAGGGQQEAAPADQAAMERKIIYTAELTLVVEDFSKTESAVPALVSRFGGYISASHVDRTQGDRRSGSWTVRIPVDRFDDFLDAAVDLGVPENRTTQAQDVSEEFVDLEARIKNKREVERRIAKLLEDRSGDIKDVIAVETELGRVREEIERMEGRLRYLTNHTALTTVTINAREERDYVPPQAPTFTAQIGHTWTGSLEALMKAGKALTLTGVAITPWLPVTAVPVVLSFWLVRRRLKAA